jgi:hypothetical protein
VVATFTAGQKLRASNLTAVPLGLVAWNERTTDITTTATTAATAQRIITTGGPVVAGRQYLVIFDSQFRTSSSTDVVELSLRITTDGTEPTASSLRKCRALVALSVTDVPESLTCQFWYLPTTSHTFTVTSAMHFGSGTGTLTCDGETDDTTHIAIIDLGLAVAKAGAIY